MGFSEHTVNKDTPVPLHYQLKQIILGEIQSGGVGPDEAIPTETELCALYRVSRTTVRQSIAALVNEGWLYRVKSKGTFVASPPQQIRTNLSYTYTSFIEDVRQLRMKPSIHVDSIQIVRPTAIVARELELGQNEQVICVRRHQMADNAIISCIESYLPYPLCGQATDAEKYSRGSLYQILGECPETALDRLERRIYARCADAKEAKELDIQLGEAIILVFNRGLSAQGERPVLCEWIRYIGSKNMLVLDYRLDQEKY